MVLDETIGIAVIMAMTLRSFFNTDGQACLGNVRSVLAYEGSDTNNLRNKEKCAEPRSQAAHRGYLGHFQA